MFASLIALALSSPAAAPAPAPAKTDDGTTWPVVGESDFKLAVDLIVDAEKDDKGVLHIEGGKTLKLRLNAEKDCDVAVYWIDPKGAIIQLFPNRYETNSRLKAGENRVLPGDKKDYELATIPTTGEGVDRLHVVAITGKLPALPKGEAQGGFIAFRSEADKKEVIRAVRGVVSRDRGIVIRDRANPGAAGDTKVAQAELKFHVKP